MISLNALEISIIVGECRQRLSGGRVRNVYQPSPSSIILKTYVGEGVLEFWMVAGECIFYTDRELVKPQKPTTMATILRRALNGLRITDIRQIESERIVEINLAGGLKSLIVELMPPGNIALLEEGKIVHVMRRARSRSRVIGIGDIYTPPQRRYSYMLGDASPEIFSKLRHDSPIVAALSRDLGLGGKFAEEILSRAGVGKDVIVERLSKDELDRLLDSLKDVENLIRHPSPRVYLVGDAQIPSPIEMRHINFDYIETSTFSEAVARAYLTQLGVERRREIVGPLMEKLKDLEKALREKETVLDSLRARASSMEKGLGLLNIIADEITTTQAADRLKDHGIEMVIHDNSIDVTVGGHTFHLRRDQSIRRQISHQYDELKTIRQTIKGLEEEVAKIVREIGETKNLIEESDKVAHVVEKERPSVRTRREFKTSDGFLVIAGRDVKSNIHLLRNVMEALDLVLHAEIPGSPVTLIKKGMEAPHTTIEEAAQYTACYSRAWREGFTSASVYYVGPDQISLSAPSGQYLPRGSFMVYGRRRYTEVQLRLAAYLDDGLPAIVPYLTASRTGLYFVELRPGMTESREAAVEILKLLGCEVGDEMVDVLSSLIPYGRCSILFRDKLIRT